MKKLEDLPSIEGSPTVYPLTDAPYELAQFVLQATQEEPQPSAIVINYVQGTISVYPKTSQSPRLEFTRESLVYLLSNEPLALVEPEEGATIDQTISCLQDAVGSNYAPHTFCLHPDREDLAGYFRGDVLWSPIVSQNSALLVAASKDKDVSPSWKALIASLPLDLHTDLESR